MKPVAQPTALVRVGAAMIAIPAVVLLLCSTLGFGAVALHPSRAREFAGPAGLGLGLFTIPFALILFAEYRAVARCSSRAAAWIAGICLYLTLCGLIGWVGGLLSLSGITRAKPDWGSWNEFALYSGVLVYLAFAGVAHLKWWRRLRDAKTAISIDPAALE